jgi:hypothetical protein
MDGECFFGRTEFVAAHTMWVVADKQRHGVCVDQR